MNKKRLISLDVFRGLTIMIMTIVNNPGSWSHIYPPLAHAEWNGCTPTDLVFPFFIFIMGTAIPLAMPNKHFDSTVLNKIVVRSLRIFCLGLFLNYFDKIELLELEGISLLIIRIIITGIVGVALLGSFSQKLKIYFVLTILAILLFLAFGQIESYENIRMPGVLQRIGIVYFFTSLLFLKTTFKFQIGITVSMLLLYWFLMSWIPVPGFGESNLEKGTNLAAWLDNYLLNGHLWSFSKTWDPEGILSTIPAIATGIIGILIGQVLNLDADKIEITKKLSVISVSLIVLGLIWSIFFPINKSLWSSSYVIYSAGWAVLILTLLYYLIEIANYKKWTKIFVIWGVNPMIVFFLSGIFPSVWSMIKIQNPEMALEQINIKDYFYLFFITPLFDNPLNESLAFALFYVLLWTVILWFLFKYKIVFKV